MKRKICMCLALVLLLGSLQGCMLFGNIVDDPAKLGSLLPTEPSASVDESGSTPIKPPEVDWGGYDVPQRLLNGGMRDYAPDGWVDMVKFSEMEYVRPDVDALLSAFEDLAAMAENGEDADAILEEFFAVSDDYLNFYTMDMLAYIRYTINTTDSFYKDEYDVLELASPDVEEKLEAFFKACVDSPSRFALERKYFGYGFFELYEDYSLYTNEAYLALAKQEEELLAEYRSALEDPQIEFDGETQSFWALMEQYGDPATYDEYMTYLDILRSYYTQYNARVGGVFLELVKVRRQIAEVLDYDSYADYSYDLVYGRDYTHAQGQQFLAQVRAEMVPVYEEMLESELYYDLSQFDMDVSLLPESLFAAVQNMGGAMEDAFVFMMAYELCDLSASDEKYDASFTTYLYNYEAPFLTINAHGTSADYSTFSHEFGHFTDSFVNYDAEEDLETAETFSQAMEFLALCYSEGAFTDRQVRELIQLNLMDMLETYAFQSALAQFEERVYALSDDELTIERINEIYSDCCKEYGVYDDWADFYYYYGWIDVTHFFEMPFYVISYVVSADTALQVYMLETETEGEGLAAYNRLLEREAGLGVRAVMESAGLDDPFREGGLEETAAFFRDALELR